MYLHSVTTPQWFRRKVSSVTAAFRVYGTYCVNCPIVPVGVGSVAIRRSLSFCWRRFHRSSSSIRVERCVSLQHPRSFMPTKPQLLRFSRYHTLPQALDKSTISFHSSPTTNKNKIIEGLSQLPFPAEAIATIAMPEKNQKPSTGRRDSCHELEARTTATSRQDDLLLVAVERPDRTFYLDHVPRPETAKETMTCLRKKLGAWKPAAAYVRCQRHYIAIGTLEVGESHTPPRLTWSLMRHVVDE
jgi:hypothetical protein